MCVSFRFKHPVLDTFGGQLVGDQFLPVEDAIELYRLIPIAQLAVVPNAEHFVTRMRGMLFADLAKEFVTRR